MRFILVVLFLLLSNYSLIGNEFKSSLKSDLRIGEEKMDDIPVLVDNISEYCNVKIECEWCEADVFSIKLLIKNISEKII